MEARLERYSDLGNKEVLPEEEGGFPASAAVTNGEEGGLRLDHDAQHQRGHHKPGHRLSWWTLTGEGQA